MTHPAAPTARGQVPPDAAAARIVLRPLATPLPLGFLALGVATLAFASFQLRWIPASESHTVALAVLVLTVPLQLVACVMGFLARDAVAATGMGLLSGTWAAACLATLTSPPGRSSAGLGVVLLASAACLLVPALGARAKAVLGAVVLLSAVRFAVTGVAEIDGGRAWTSAAGWVGVALALLAFYAALALELAGTQSRVTLPVGRTGPAQRAVDGDLGDQVAGLASEPGVRRQL